MTPPDKPDASHAAANFLQRIAAFGGRKSVAIILAMVLAGMAAIFITAAPLLGVDEAGAVERWMSGASHGGVLAFLIVVAAFCILALFGAPQFVLVAATVVVFGPAWGFVYSFFGNMLACSLGFWLGRILGARAVRAFSTPAIDRLMKRLEQHDILACILIRFVPTAPFMIVNIALGVTSIRWTSFLIGTTLGSGPKIALLAWAGHVVQQLGKGGGPIHWILLGLVIASWIAMGVVIRNWLREAPAPETKT